MEEYRVIKHIIDKDIKHIKELIEELDIWIRLFGEEGEIDETNKDREEANGI